MLGVDVEHKEEILFPDYVKSGQIIASHVEEIKSEYMLGILGHFYSKTFVLQKQKILLCWEISKDKGGKKRICSNTYPPWKAK